MGPRRRQVANKKSATASKNCPCGVCKEQCVTNCIRCIDCTTWFHSACEHITSDQLNAMGLLENEYICTNCTNTDNKYNYLNALRRLSSSAANDMLESTAKMEILLLRNTPLTQVTHDEAEIQEHSRDTIALEMLQKSGMYSICYFHHVCFSYNMPKYMWVYIYISRRSSENSIV